MASTPRTPRSRRRRTRSPPRPERRPSGRRRGGQPGHQGSRRELDSSGIEIGFRSPAQRRGLEVTAQLFWLWKNFKAQIIDRRALNRCRRPLKSELRCVLERGSALDLAKVSTFCENLLALEPALWNFAKHENLEPTNNHAERVLRPAVLWHTRSFGADSDRDCRYYIERIHESCRLQKQGVYAFLIRSLNAHRTGAVKRHEGWRGFTGILRKTPGCSARPRRRLAGSGATAERLRNTQTDRLTSLGGTRALRLAHTN